MRANLGRVGLLLIAVVAALASAAAPQVHHVDKSIRLRTSFDAAWAAVIATFADRNWPIHTSDRASGLITTDWIGIAMSDPEKLADCGDSNLGSKPVANDVRFNVLVRELDGDTEVKVNATFQHDRDVCTSIGAIEAMVHDSVQMNLNVMRRRHKRATPADAGASDVDDSGSATPDPAP